jgi:hypothetical protein
MVQSVLYSAFYFGRVVLLATAMTPIHFRHTSLSPHTIPPETPSGRFEAGTR